MWTDVMNLKVTEFNSTSADIMIGFYPINDREAAFLDTEIANAFPPGGAAANGDIYIKADVPYSAFSLQGREFKIRGLLKVVCLSMCLCLLAYLTVCMSVCMCVCLWCSSVCLLCPSAVPACLPVCFVSLSVYTRDSIKTKLNYLCHNISYS